MYTLDIFAFFSGDFIIIDEATVWPFILVHRAYFACVFGITRDRKRNQLLTLCVIGHHGGPLRTPRGASNGYF